MLPYARVTNGFCSARACKNFGTNKIKYTKIANKMFLIPKSNLKKFDPERSCFVLNEFAAAEFSSAVEMLFAAKAVNNKKLSDGFIRHALDEYKHYLIFSAN